MEYLIQIAERSTILAAIAALCFWRVKSASIRHAVWSVIAAGMLIETLFGPLLPSLPLPILHPVELSAASPASAITISIDPAPRPPVWPLVAIVAYFAGVLFFASRLTFALIFTRRLIRRSEPIAPGRYQSREITVPMTAGSKILLPLAWREWDAAKLQAVLAHEEAHVRRRDSIVALIARVNRCLLWIHPLAWWIEREIARLAELACDDAALVTVQDRQQYAQALLDMARAVHTSRGRLLTSEMAKETNVENRIDRILDETRRISKVPGRRDWIALIAVAAPLIYFIAAAQLAPAQTLLAVPVPAAPKSPALVAQASPPPAPQAAPQQAAGAAGIENSVQDAAQDVEDLIRRLQAQLAKAQRDLQQAQNDHVEDGTIQNGRLYELFGSDGQWAMANREVSPGQASAPSGSQISASFSSRRSGTIMIPLGPPAEREVYVRITTDTEAGRRVVTSADRPTKDSAWALPVSLDPGRYHGMVLIKNIGDGTVEQQQFDFDVK